MENKSVTQNFFQLSYREAAEKCVECTVNATKSFEIHDACYWCMVNRYMIWRLTQISLITSNCRRGQGRLGWVESVRYWWGEQAMWSFSVIKPYVVEAGSLSCRSIALFDSYSQILGYVLWSSNLIIWKWESLTVLHVELSLVFSAIED